MRSQYEGGNIIVLISSPLHVQVIMALIITRIPTSHRSTIPIGPIRARLVIPKKTKVANVGISAQFKDLTRLTFLSFISSCFFMRDMCREGDTSKVIIYEK